MRNIVLVKGNIIGTAGHHHATEWVALAPESWEGEAAQVIEGDLVLDEKYQIIPYCKNIMGSVLVIIYYTLGQICVNSPD